MPPPFQLLILLLLGVLRSFSRSAGSSVSRSRRCLDDNDCCTLPHFDGEDRPTPPAGAGDERDAKPGGRRLARMAVVAGLVHASHVLVPHQHITPPRTPATAAAPSTAAPGDDRTTLEPFREPGQPL
jgi:hypothetical protein